MSQNFQTCIQELYTLHEGNDSRWKKSMQLKSRSVWFYTVYIINRTWDQWNKCATLFSFFIIIVFSIFFIYFIFFYFFYFLRFWTRQLTTLSQNKQFQRKLKRRCWKLVPWSRTAQRSIHDVQRNGWPSFELVSWPRGA